MESLAYEIQVANLVNQERAKLGLSLLKLNDELSYIARIKSQDMRNNRYFSHDSPIYGSPFDMLIKYRIAYRIAAENIAKGQPTPQVVMNAWMNSEGHRSNILDPVFSEIGVGFISDNQGNFWTQLFVSR